MKRSFDDITSDLITDGPRKKRKEEFVDPLLAFEDEEETADDARLRMARQLVEKVTADGEDVDEFLKRKALQDTNKWTYKWSDELEASLEKAEPKKEVFRGHRYSVTSVCISTDEKYLYSGSKDGSIIIWDLLQSKKVKVLKRDASGAKGHSKAVLSLAVNSTGDLLASGCGSGAIYIWDLTTRTVKHCMARHSQGVVALCFQGGTNTLYAGSLDRGISVWEALSGSWRELLMGPTEPLTCLHALDQETFVCSGMDKALRFFKVPTGKHLLFPKAHKSTVDAVCMLNSERWISGGNDGCIRLWNPQKRKPIFHLGACHNDKWVTALGSRAYGDVFFSGSCDGQVKVWKMENDKISEIGRLDVEGYVNSIAVSKTGKVVACAVGKDHRLGRWDVIRTAKPSIVVFRLDV